MPRSRETCRLTIKASESISEAEEQEKDWLDIIFLPFNDYWELFLMVTVVLNFFFTIDMTIYRTDGGIISEIFYYTFEGVYLVDTIAVIAHRNMADIRKTRYHRKKSMFIIAVSVASLMPYSEIFNMLHSYTWEERVQEVDFIRLKCTARLIRIFIYFGEKRNEVATKRLRLILLEQFTSFVLSTTVLGAAWYVMSCFKCKRPNWTDGLKNHHFNEESKYSWKLISWQVIASVFAHTWTGPLFGRTFYEKAFLLYCMIHGFVLHSMIFLGQLTVEFLQSYRCLFEYKARMKKIIYLLDDWGVDHQIRKRAIEYYKVFWKKRHGIKEIPDSFDFLPLSLRKEVTLDIFWELLRHSHLFRDTNMSFKRYLCLVMSTKFLLPGDFLFRTEEPKTNLVYLVSGIVKVLSDEDDETPLMSLSGGTLLGEIGCLMSTKSKMNIRCETYCEIQVLRMSDLYRVLRESRSETKILQGRLHDRINYAKWAKSDLVPSVDAERNFKASTTTVDTLKTQWKTIFKLSKSRKFDENKFKQLNRCFSSNYLDTLVLSEDVELKLKVICLNSNFPFIMDPDSNFRRFLEYSVIAAVMLQAIILPYPIVFLRNITGAYLKVSFFLDFVYVLDILLQLTTAVVSDNMMLTKFVDIALYRFKQTTFIVDILSAVPYNAFLNFLGISDRISTLSNVSRFLKFYKIFQLISRREQNISSNYVYIRLIKYTVILIFAIYWSGNTLYGTACIYKTCFIRHWFAYNAALENMTLHGDNLQRVLYYSISLVLNINISDNAAYIVSDMILILVIVYLGYVVYSFCFAELAAFAVSQTQGAHEHQDEIAVFTAMMRSRGVDKELRTRLLDILEFSWIFNEGAEIYGEGSILAGASEQLKSDIINDRIIKCLKLVPLFKDCSEILVRKFSLQAQLTILPAGAYILNTNIMSHYIYIIIRGYCQMNSMLPGDAERKCKIILKRGDMLALIETLHCLRVFGPVLSVTAVELLCINYRAFLDIFQSSRHEYMYLHTALEQHMKSYESILLRKGSRLYAMKSVRTALGKVDTFTYQIKEEDVVLPAEFFYKKPFEDLGTWSFVRYLLLRRTIDPRGTFFITWEIFRCSLAFVDIICSLLYLNLLFEYRSTIDVVLDALRLYCIADLYVRMHCQYHTNEGILVSHPLLTASHYFRTSMIVDALSTIPFNSLGIPKLFGVNHVRIALTCLRLIFRPLQLHRFYSAVSLIESTKHWSTAGIILKVRTVTLLLILLGVLANFMMVLKCDYTGNLVTCASYDRMKNSVFGNQKDPGSVFVHTLYYTVALFTNSMCGLFTVKIPEEFAFFTCVIFVLFTLRTWMLATFTCSGIGGNAQMGEYQIRMKQFLRFSKENLLGDSLVKETVEHYAYVWKETLGMDVSNIASNFNVYLRIEFVLSLYEACLNNSEILGDAPTPLLQRVAPCLKKIHYKKGANIIRCNDVQGTLYFVYRGKVNICVANSVVTTLDVGGTFGCFMKQGITRQTIAATAEAHTAVLALDSLKLHEIFEEWNDKSTQAALKNIRLLNIEFMNSRGKIATETYSDHCGDDKTSRYQKLVTKLNSFIDYDGKTYIMFQYVLNVHVAAISSITILANIAISVRGKSDAIMSVFIYAIDALFLLKMFFSFTLYYTDPDTGHKVTNAKKICVRHLKTDFVLHLCTFLPFELLLLGFFDNYTKLGTANRVLRFTHFFSYYSSCTNILTVTTHYRWSYPVYKALFGVQLIANIWFPFACFPYYCKKVETVHGRPIIINNTTTLHESAVYGYSYVISILTSSGFRDAIPTTRTELMASSVVALISLFIIVSLSSGYANIVMIENSAFFRYQHKVLQLAKYLKIHDLSPLIFDNVWKYLLQLWKIQNGAWMPKLISEAPNYLKQDIMYHLYGYHLENHFLFEKTHKDFIRQLVPLLERHVFLPGNMIVEQGDTDDNMYFLHSGEVGVYVKHDSSEILSCLLTGEKSFGEAEGLYSIPYKMSYKATTVVDILSLKTAAWMYLLKWFPASHEVLTTKAFEYGLTSCDLSETCGVFH